MHIRSGHKFKRIGALLFAIVIAIASLSGCGSSEDRVTRYSSKESWAYFGENNENARSDVFFVCPTVYMGDGDSFNMSLSDPETREAFVGAVNMEKGIYDQNSRFFAPFYRQAGMNAYKLSAAEQEKYLDIAYSDIKAAFEYYLRNENGGRGIILAGFSQGADMCLRLLKDCFKEDDMNEQLIACYAIGWRITEREMREYPHLKFAKDEDDIGVIVSFNSEAEEVKDSLIVPEGTSTLCINPLNWQTDSTPAHRLKNSGACFTDSDGNIEREVKGFVGAYIDPLRGTLKVPDLNPEEYPAGPDIFGEGVYHIYDHQFFYRNLQKNVAVRLSVYLSGL